jgi:hypothetical protein
MGGWYDNQGAAAAFRHVAVLPAILTVVFGALYLHFRARGGYRAIKLEKTPRTGFSRTAWRDAGGL